MIDLPPEHPVRPARARLTLGPTAATVLALVLTGSLAADGPAPAPTADPPVPTGLQLDDQAGPAELLRTDQGLRYRLRHRDGRVEWLSPDQFTRRLWQCRHDRPWLEIVLNISSPVGILWVAVGLLGQVLFTGRMIVQWLVSEKEKRSVVPVAFWWMSLVGATMLIIYFIWRKDIVGILGQATGWLIYVRNLWFIYVPPRRRPSVAADPGPEPELPPPPSHPPDRSRP